MTQRIYVSHAITGIEPFQRAKDLYTIWCDLIDELGNEAVNPLEHSEQLAMMEGMSEQELHPFKVYSQDMRLLKSCDLLVADLTHPSPGAAMEIALFMEGGDPVSAFAQKQSKVSKFVEGFLFSHNVRIYRYTTLGDEDMVAHLKSELWRYA